MGMPELSGALTGLVPAAYDDLERYKQAVEAAGQTGWGYYFPYLLSQNRPGKSAVLLAEDEGSLCVFRWKRRHSAERLDLYLPPIPMNLSVLGRCLERANDFNADLSALVVRVDEQDVAALSEQRRLRVRERRRQYLFAPRAYESLVGKRLYTVRRQVRHVERLAEVEVRPYTVDLAEQCRALLSRWSQAHRAAHGTAGGAGVTRRTLEMAGNLPERDLAGEVVYIDGELKAFAFGGEIRPGLACSFDRKCEERIRGLSYFHFRSFLLSLREFDRVNDGSDARRAGLRQFKQSFRPVETHSEYRASQRRRD